MHDRALTVPATTLAALALGGTASDDNGALVLVLASGGLLLTGAVGALVARRRMS
jgi:hypothetical protein